MRCGTTSEKLIKANNINEKLNTYKKFVKAYDGVFSNSIRANNFDGNRDSSEIILLDNEPELSLLIREYFINKIDYLEKEFANL